MGSGGWGTELTAPTFPVSQPHFSTFSLWLNWLVFPTPEPLHQFLLVDWTECETDQSLVLPALWNKTHTGCLKLISVFLGISLFFCFSYQTFTVDFRFFPWVFLRPWSRWWYLLWHCGGEATLLAVHCWLSYLCSWEIRWPCFIIYEGFIWEKHHSPLPAMGRRN